MKIKVFVASAMFLAVSSSDGRLISLAYEENIDNAFINYHSSKKLQTGEDTVNDNFSFDSGTCMDVGGLGIDNQKPNSTKINYNGCE